MWGRSSGSNVVLRRARPGLAGLRRHNVPWDIGAFPSENSPTASLPWGGIPRAVEESSTTLRIPTQGSGRFLLMNRIHEKLMNRVHEKHSRGVDAALLGFGETGPNLPIPYTLTPYTLHPTPYTLHPTPCTLHPTPYAQNPTPFTLHHTP